MANKKISDYSELTTPADGDLFEIVDISDTSEAPTGTNKKIAYSNISTADASTTVKGKVELATDAEAATSTDTVRALTPSNGQSIVAGATVAAAGKTTPVDADSIPLVDSAASNILKELTWANLKATLLTYLTDVTTTWTNKTLTAPVITAPVIKNFDGWNTVSDTWTYLSASSVTVPTGAASLYQIGDKVKFTQTTVKYFTVSAVTDTTLSFIVNTDYVVANAAISLVFLSHKVSPLGFPAFFNYTSTVTGMTTSTATLQYMTVGRMCYVFMSNTSQTSNSATFNVTGPVTMSSTPAQFFQGGIGSLDNGTWQTVAAVSGIFAGTNTIKFGISAATFAANAFGGFTASGGKAVQGIIAYTF